MSNNRNRSGPSPLTAAMVPAWPIFNSSSVICFRSAFPPAHLSVRLAIASATIRGSSREEYLQLELSNLTIGVYSFYLVLSIPKIALLDGLPHGLLQ